MAAGNTILNTKNERQATQQKSSANAITGSGISMSAIPVLQQKESGEEHESIQKKTSDKTSAAELNSNRTGMPHHLKAGIENLSGMDMSDVKVHYNSSQPAQLNALAYAQGNDIHIGPGQEKHLAHEAWHVVQQRQGRVKPTLQMKTGMPVNDDPTLEQEADKMGEKALSAVKAEPPAQFNQFLTQNKTVQRVLIPGSRVDTARIDPNPGLIGAFSVIQLMGLWGLVYNEDAENALPWRLAICGVILSKLAERNYGAYDRSMLEPISARDVNAGLLNRVPMGGGGENKSVSTITVPNPEADEQDAEQPANIELVAARMQGERPVRYLTNEVSMLQILGMLGVRVPALYGAQGADDAQPDLPADAQGKLNMLMQKVNSSVPGINIYDLGANQLAPRLSNYITQHHGNSADTFNILRGNMLRDLTRLRDVYQVLAIADLQVLIEDGTGHLCALDPGAVVPAGHAGDQDKETTTRENLINACEVLEALQFAPAVANPYPITREDAIYIGAFSATAGQTKHQNLLYRINKVLKGPLVDNVAQVTVTAAEVRGVIQHNAGLEDLGEVVEGEDIDAAVALLPA